MKRQYKDSAWWLKGFMKNGDQGQEGVLANRYGKFAETGSLDFAFLLIINYIKNDNK